MNKFSVGEWTAHIEYRPDWLGFVLFLWKDSDGKREFITQNGEVHVVRPGEALKTEEHYFARFEDDQQLQALAEAISKRGVKADNEHKTEGLLKATKYHLEDMRRLVFEPPTPINPKGNVEGDGNE